MKCPVCGGAELESGIRDVPYVFRGHKIQIEAKGDYCPACGEVLMDPEESAVFMAKVKKFKAEIISQTIEPGFIAQVRKKLALTQQEAGEVFGGGVNAFSRYENGKSQPHPSTVKLLRILDKHPELLTEIRI
ncbi:HTH-type transcriptional regulator/antitoxin MqsA [Erwinia toletana]|uniref:HTH-type transcriptional regulator/antitoxin MqsA n=1 Tax=Winslowiella toletana TaxID=92490 RepID=A0ABS4P9V5_9GAMM|nr:type II TA system antitoxin MqsA family protein [Winslowiella toletana]MBP2168733.1 HTH-type transcriptional regulator/antitoxin MqsA [Winslowiella toletana]